MTPDTRLSEIDTANPTYLLVSHNTGEPRVVPLTVGASVFVGSGSNCKVQVPDESVQQLHCMFVLQANNILKIQDWNTDATFLNDKCVSNEAQVHSGDAVSYTHLTLPTIYSV